MVPDSGAESSSPPAPPQRNKVPPQQIPQKEISVPTKANPILESSERKSSTENETFTKNSPNVMTEKHNPATCEKEPVINIIPINVDHPQSAPEDPKTTFEEKTNADLNPNVGSRGPSLEPQATPAKSPTPARSSQQPEQPVKDPKIAKLDKIKEEVEILMEKISNFKGTKQDKEYLYLDEMLTRHLIALDGIEPEGQQEIRQIRKESIKSVNRCLSLLDAKVNESLPENNNKILSELTAASEGSS
jgi:hypothetical protein